MANNKNRNMQVVLRVRPLSRSEMEQNQRSIIRVADPNTIIFDPDQDEDEFFFHGTRQAHRDITKKVSKNLTMAFDQVFDNQATNQDVFEFSMRPLVVSVLQGYNCSAFVYGATGAGKTYTMLGNENSPGIAYLTMKELFSQIESNSEETKFDIGISYLEVYNEQVMNLLTKSGPLKLREDGTGVVIGGLSLKPIFDADGLLSLLALGNRNRTQHPTDANAESSRSHAIFQVHIRMTNKTTNEKRMVKLSMIDLAGSERGSSTKCVGQRFKEGASINKSLLALGNCINKLADGSKHIPYRDSNMTRILKDSLGGNCQTVMIANISPSSLTYEDTYNTLKYASRAQKIRTTALTKNALKTNLPKEYYVRKLTDSTAEVDQLKKRIKMLESQLASQKQNNNNNSNGNAQSLWAEILDEAEQWKEKIDEVFEQMKEAQESFYSLSSSEKLLKFRTKLKENIEQTRKLFNMDGELLSRDTARVEASIGKYAKQIEAYRIDKERWMGRFKDFKNQLAKIRHEIANQKSNGVLQQYLIHKNDELRIHESSMKSNHSTKVLQMYTQEIEGSRKTIKLSSEILQENYLVLSANLLLTDEMRLKYHQLYKVQGDGQRGVKFTEIDEIMPTGSEINAINGHHANEIVFNNEMTMFDMVKDDFNENGESSGFGAKRAREGGDDSKPSKRFARAIFNADLANANANMNSTQVLETLDDIEELRNLPVIDGDSTFAIKPKISAAPVKRPVLLSRPLKDSNPLNKDFAIPRTTTVKKTKPTNFQQQREKENKQRTPLKVRKSPRRSPANELNKILIVNRPKNKLTDSVVKRLKTDPARFNVPKK